MGTFSISVLLNPGARTESQGGACKESRRLKTEPTSRGWEEDEEPAKEPEREQPERHKENQQTTHREVEERALKGGSGRQHAVYLVGQIRNEEQFLDLTKWIYWCS